MGKTQLTLEKRTRSAERKKPAPVIASETADGPLKLGEARKRAKQRVFRSAESLVGELIENSSGNYLAVKFLFEFAGLIGEDVEDSGEESPLLKSLLERAQKDFEMADGEQTRAVNLNLCSNDSSQIGR